jgi:hypothetical protein
MQHDTNALRVACRKQGRQAIRRGIAWELTFDQWLSVWTESGKLHLRGQGAGKYVMSRRGDSGAYALGNVYIQLGSENNREAANLWRGKKKQFPGVYLLYPGTERAWLAKFARVSIGYFESAEAANAAREAYMQANDLRNNSALGCAALGYQKQDNRYVMRAAGRRSSHDTPEEARAAYLAAIEQIKAERAAALGA